MAVYNSRHNWFPVFHVIVDGAGDCVKIGIAHVPCF